MKHRFAKRGSIGESHGYRCSRLFCTARALEGGLDASALKFGIVVAKFNDLVTRPLLKGTLAAIERHGGDIDANCEVRILRAT